jgi:hypothetical protein
MHERDVGDSSALAQAGAQLSEASLEARAGSRGAIAGQRRLTGHVLEEANEGAQPGSW